MGVLLRFPVERCEASTTSRPEGPGVSADIVILPTVRIERCVDLGNDLALRRMGARRAPRRQRGRRHDTRS